MKRKRTLKNDTVPAQKDRIVSPSEVYSAKRRKGLIPLTRTTLWRMCQEGTFPAPMQLSPGRQGWWLSTIRQWAADRQKHPAKQRPYDFGRTRAPDHPPSP